MYNDLTLVPETRISYDKLILTQMVYWNYAFDFEEWLMGTYLTDETTDRQVETSTI